MTTSLAKRLEVTQAVSDYSRLLNLDSLWTSYLESAKAIDESDLAALESITDEMKRLLYAVPANASMISASSADMGEETLQAAYDRLRAENHLTDDQRRGIDAHIKKNGKLVTSASNSAAHLAIAAGEEIRTLDEKMQVLRGGNFAPGDMRPETICALAAEAFVGGVIAFETGVGAALALAGAAYLATGNC